MRNYRNAVPEEFESSPTQAEFSALATARLIALKKGPGGVGIVPVQDGSGNSAHALLGGPGDWLSGIWRQDRHAPGGWHHIKKWRGVPEPYNDFGIREVPDVSRQNRPGGNVFIQGPGPQRHVVYEDIYVQHQRRFIHERGQDEHIESAPPQDVHIGIEGSKVHYQEGEAVEYHHAPKQGLLSWIIKGSPRPQPQAIAAPRQQQESYRGALQSAPVQHAPALPPPQRQRAPALQPPARSLDEAIDFGRLDCQAGAQPHHNPYGTGDGRHGAWAEGWRREAQGRPLGLAPPQRQPVMIEHQPAAPATGWFSSKKQRV
jgi:hypothetical protein